MKHRIVVTRRIPEVGLRLLKRPSTTVAVSTKPRPLTRREILRMVRGAHAILTQLTDRVDATVLDAAGPQLRIVANYAVGYDNIDRAAASARGVTVTNTPGILTEAVADHTFALMLAVARRIVESDQFTREGKYHGWAPDLLLGQGIGGKTLGIIGSGRIGQAVAARARGFGMPILYTDPVRNRGFERRFGARFVPLRSLLEHSDVVSLHVPLTPKTHHLIGVPELAQMKPTAVLVNTARGPVVDEAALIRAVATRRIFGAGLDVYECEPEITCDVTSHRLLAKLPNIVLTPHTASATVEARVAMAVVAAENILAVLSGRKAKNDVTRA